jgi:magnesium chelatase family protein
VHATVFSGAILGVDGLTVEVEVDITRGIPAFSIVGLPNTAVRESRERVTAAIKNTGLEFPLERITVNLAPADIKKEGAAFDLAIAMGIVLAAALKRTEGVGLPPEWRRVLFLGELTLGGEVRKVRGVLPILLHAKRHGFTRAVIPHGNYPESVYVAGVEVFACKTLSDVLALVLESAPRRLKSAVASRAPGHRGAAWGAGARDGGAADDGAFGAPRGQNSAHKGDATIVVTADPQDYLHKSADRVERPVAHEDDDPANRFGDMRDVVGQETVKRALLVAAAGGHHVLMSGPPGAGKTMLARRFCSILPPLDEQAALETTMIYSTAGLLDGAGLVTRSPFRAPHHSASDAGLIGGGNIPRPGEVTLAHNGVLFMDELPEFKRHVLETLREPLEEGRITISRAKSAVTFPARFQLIAAMNPCPCGQSGSADKICRCGPQVVERYLSKISGPLLDRIAIHVFVRPVELSAFASDGRREASENMRTLVVEARERQRHRVLGVGSDGSPAASAEQAAGVSAAGESYESRAGGGAFAFLNTRLTERLVRKHCRLDDAGSDLLIRAQKQLRVSARGRGHLLRVARTIADLEGSDSIKPAHVAEAVQYAVREHGG